MMRLRAVRDAEALVKILDWFAGDARADLLLVASLTVQVATEALVGDGVGVRTQGALRETIGGRPFLLLPNEDVALEVGHVVGALGEALTIDEEGKCVFAHDAVSVGRSITELACFMASNVSDLDVLVPLRAHMSEHTELILLSSDHLNVSVQHALVTLPELEIIDGKVGLENVFHVDCCDRRVTHAKSVKGIFNFHE